MTGRLPQSEASGYAPGMASVTATLRAALERCGQSRYAVSKATGIPQSTLSRFVAGRKPLRGENIDRLAHYLGLVLTPRAGKTRKGR
jgi:transcriptional regulator with XRE-family HTH domain